MKGAERKNEHTKKGDMHVGIPCREDGKATSDSQKQRRAEESPPGVEGAENERKGTLKGNRPNFKSRTTESSFQGSATRKILLRGRVRESPVCKKVV